jgi:hypothetical protein
VKKILAILVVSLVVGLTACATAPAIVPDKPQPNQCFEGPFSIYRLNSEEWKPVATQPPLYFLRNPVPGALPCILIAVIVPPGSILRYGYLDNGQFRSFMFNSEKDCYIEEKLDPAFAEEGKQLLMRLCKEAHC